MIKEAKLKKKKKKKKKSAEREGKLATGIFSPSSISSNDNAIVRNFYTKKVYSSKIPKICCQLEGICICFPLNIELRSTSS